MRRDALRGAALALLVSAAATAQAHEVRLDVSEQAAAVLQLRYANGEAFAYEAYELYRPGKDVPEQVGRTSAQGQVVFLPGAQTQWRLKTFSADGHGVDRVITVAAGPSAPAAAPPPGEPPRAWLLAAGLGVVFGLFGVLQLFVRRNSK